MFYTTKAPGWLKMFYKNCIWKLNPAEKTVYLTFDDGPNPRTTPFILDQLDQFGAKATFFCIGKNVERYPDLFQEIFSRKHAIGNHTYEHLNGWKTKTSDYLEDIKKAKAYIPSNLFRPPYGKIKPGQVKALLKTFPDTRIMMWDIISGDFDPDKKPQDCLQDVLFNYRSGSIIVFHDSDKAWERTSYILPRLLKHFGKQGFRMNILS